MSAAAGTRPRGSDEGEDAALAYEMLLSPKEHTEFAIVREEVRRALATVAAGGPNGVKAELEKGVLRHFSVQHLYARLGATLNVFARLDWCARLASRPVHFPAHA